MYFYDTYKSKTKSFNIRKEYELPDIKVIKPEEVYSYMSKHFKLQEKTEEHLYLMCVKTSGEVEGIFLLSRGTVNGSFCSPAEIFKRVLILNTPNFILVHNHPSGDATVSMTDIQTTRKINELSTMMGTSLLDHIVVGENKFNSLKELGYL